MSEKFKDVPPSPEQKQLIEAIARNEHYLELAENLVSDLIEVVKTLKDAEKDGVEFDHALLSTMQYHQNKPGHGGRIEVDLEAQGERAHGEMGPLTKQIKTQLSLAKEAMSNRVINAKKMKI